MQDTYRHKGQRKKLTEELKKKGIEDEKVLAAILKVPRHFFMDIGFDKLAYQNKAFPIGAGQTISQPYTVAFQSQLLDIKKGDKVLEIGTGSGYQTAVLIELGARVHTIERQQELFQNSRIILASLGYEAHFFYGDGYKGKPTYGPYDKIIVTAGAPYIPQDLKEQLKIGGILVIPVGNSKEQIMYSVIRVSKTEFKETELGNFVFVPMLEGKANTLK